VLRSDFSLLSFSSVPHCNPLVVGVLHQFFLQRLRQSRDPGNSLSGRQIKHLAKMPVAEKAPQTLYDKVLASHIVDEKLDGTILLYIGKE